MFVPEALFAFKFLSLGKFLGQLLVNRITEPPIIVSYTWL